MKVKNGKIKEDVLDECKSCNKKDCKIKNFIRKIENLEIIIMDCPYKEANNGL